MNKYIPLKEFIILLFLLMLMIFYIYVLYIYPNIKHNCVKIDYCSQTISCDCENDICKCFYYDEDNNIKEIECPNTYLD